MDGESAKDLNRLREGKEDIRDTISHLDEYLESKGPRWFVYDSGAFGPMGYFEKESSGSFQTLKSAQEIMNEVGILHELGIKVLMLDIMGQGKAGVELGADLSIGWTYKKNELKDLTNRVIEEGDIFDQQNLNRLLGSLKEKIQAGFKLTDVFFRSDGGFWMYHKNPYALAYLYDNVLRPLYELALIGTRFFLDLTTRSEIQTLLATLTQQGYKISNQPYSEFLSRHLLQKTEETPTLPSLRSLGMTIAD